MQSAQSFEEAWSQLMDWIEVQRENLEGMPPPDEDANILQEQIEENKVLLYTTLQTINMSIFHVYCIHTCKYIHTVMTKNTAILNLYISTFVGLQSGSDS